MPFMQWNARYSVNVAAMDAQHQRLVAMLNQLHEAMAAGQGAAELASVLGGLADYTHTHFGAEELLMQRAGVPDLVQHKALHQALIQEVVSIRDGLARKQDATAVDVLKTLQFLKTWLNTHILEVDRAYGEFMTR